MARLHIFFGELKYLPTSWLKPEDQCQELRKLEARDNIDGTWPVWQDILQEQLLAKVEPPNLQEKMHHNRRFPEDSEGHPFFTCVGLAQSSYSRVMGEHSSLTFDFFALK